MRLVASAQGSVVIKYSADEARPPEEVLARDVVAFLAETYQFSLKPEVPPGVFANYMFTFQTGEMSINDKKIPVTQLTLVPGGGIITAKDTDTAEIIARHIMKSIDDKFGYKITEHIRSTYYLSYLIIDFDPALEQQLSAFSRVKAVLEREMPRPDGFDLKHLRFGSEVTNPLTQTVDDIPRADFILERRAGELHSVNRYVSTAPLKSAEHERVLRLVEEALRG